MFKNNLVPLDGSRCAEYALPIAARLARASHGTLILLNVVTTTLGLAPYAQEPILVQKALDAASMRAAEYLANITQSQQLEGIETKAVIYAGSAALTILETAAEQHADLIVMTTHEYTGFKRWAIGSVTQQVARHSAAPVLALRAGGTFPASSYPDASRPLHTVTGVVALDGSELAEEAISPAAHLVSALAAPAPGLLHLVQVVQFPEIGGTPDDQRRRNREMAINEAEDYLREVARDLREQLEKQFHLSVTWSIVVDSDIPHALIACAEQGKATRGAGIFGGSDILAVATHGRGGLSRLLLGSVSEALLGRTRLPLLIVRPRQG